MDNAGTLRCFPATVIGPSLHFHFAGRDEGFEFEHFVGRFDESVASALFEANVLQEHLSFFVGFEFGNVGFSLCSKHKHFGAFVLYGFAYAFHIFIARGSRCLVDVAHVEHGL